jgi:acetylornithine deacetylase
MMTKQEMNEKIVEQVERAFDEQIAFLSRLISFPTMAGREGACQAFFADSCRTMGLDVELFQADMETIKTHPAYTEIGVPYEGRPNVIARLRGQGGGKSLILNGHIDEVPPEPVSEWTNSPWEAVVKEDRLQGRGALDMKGGVSAMFFALKAVIAAGLRPKGDVILETVVEEELGGSGGSLACLLHGVTADAMVTPECSQQRIWISHPGIKYFRVKVIGKPTHAALSHEGVNAIVKMVPIITALDRLDRQRAERLSYPLLSQDTGRSCNLSIGKMLAGEWVSTVAGWAVLECRVGFVPGESGQSVMEEIERTVREAVKDDPWLMEHPPEIEWFGWNAEPWVEPPDSPLIKQMVETSAKVPGMGAKVTAAPCGLDSRFGIMFGTPSISFGPKGGSLHGVDEWVDLKSLKGLTKVYALFICDWCGVSGQEE